MISIIDYGIGNIKAFTNIYKELKLPSISVTKPQQLKTSSRLILPGVGTFDQAMDRLNKSGMRDDIEELVFEHNVPILGVCVGMQIMADSGEEGHLAGLGWINGSVKKINVSRESSSNPLPHMGWNNVKSTPDDQLFKSLNQNSQFYFLHSYYFDCKLSDNVMATATYGETFTCAIKSSNIFGVQFHPEKSHQNGITLLKNFSNL
jgi:glutamine amidotransferase